MAPPAGANGAAAAAVAAAGCGCRCGCGCGGSRPPSADGVIVFDCETTGTDRRARPGDRAVRPARARRRRAEPDLADQAGGADPSRRAGGARHHDGRTSRSCPSFARARRRDRRGVRRGRRDRRLQPVVRHRHAAGRVRSGSAARRSTSPARRSSTRSGCGSSASRAACSTRISGSSATGSRRRTRRAPTSRRPAACSPACCALQARRSGLGARSRACAIRSGRAGSARRATCAGRTRSIVLGVRQARGAPVHELARGPRSSFCAG